MVGSVASCSIAFSAVVAIPYITSQSLSLDDLPDAWNTAMNELMDLTPPDDRDGCLQDIHWFDGAFGYFPSYCLGNLLAAQLWNAARDDLPDLDNSIETGQHDGDGGLHAQAGGFWNCGDPE